MMVCRLTDLMLHIAFAGLTVAHKGSTGVDLQQQMRAIDAWVSRPEAANLALAAWPHLVQAAATCEETAMRELRTALHCAHAQHVELQKLGQILSTAYDNERSRVRLCSYYL